jgi:hypothetical protein
MRSQQHISQVFSSESQVSFSNSYSQWRVSVCLWCLWKWHFSYREGFIDFLTTPCRTLKTNPKSTQFVLFSSVICAFLCEIMFWIIIFCMRQEFCCFLHIRWDHYEKVTWKKIVQKFKSSWAVWSKLKLAKSSQVQVGVWISRQLTGISRWLTNFTDNSQLKNFCSSDKVYDQSE